MTNEAMALADELDKVRQLVREHIGPTMDKVVKRAVAALRTAAQPANVKWDNRPSCSFPEMAQPAVTTGAEPVYTEEQLRIGVQYIDWDENLDTPTEVRQLGEAISRMGGPRYLPAANTAGDVREALIKSRDLFRLLLKEKKLGVQYAAANQLCHQISAALSTPTPAPAVTGDVRSALESAEKSFEFIRARLVKNLTEPERSAFWEAVEATKRLRAALSQQAPATDAEEVDPADVWDEYCAEVPADRRSPQGAMAFALSRPQRESPSSILGESK